MAFGDRRSADGCRRPGDLGAACLLSEQGPPCFRPHAGEPGPFNLSRHRRSPLLGSHGRPNWRSTTWVTPKLTAIDISEIASASDSPFAAIKKCLISRNASRVAPSSEDLAKISVCALSPSSARQLGKLKPAAPLHARLAGGGAPADGRAEARGFVGSRRAAERGTVAGRPRFFEPLPSVKRACTVAEPALTSSHLPAA